MSHRKEFYLHWIMDAEDSGIITGSEAILKAYASKHSLNARAIYDLIKEVLKT